MKPRRCAVFFLGFALAGCGAGGSSPGPDAATGGGNRDGAMARDGAAPEADAADEPTPDLAPDGPEGRGLYVSPAGDDTGPGTPGEPWKTIAKAAKAAMPGDTIWLLDGTYDMTTEPRIGGGNAAPCGTLSGVVIPAGVTVAAANPGMAKIAVSGSHGLCLEGATIRDLDFSHPPSGGIMIQALSGDNVIHGCTFADAYCGGGSGWEAAVVVRGAATMKFVPGRATNFMGAGGCAFLTVSDDAQATFEGGSVAGGRAGSTSGAALMIVRDRAKLTLKGTLLESADHNYAITLAHTPTLVVQPGSRLRGFKIAGILARASAPGATVTLDGVTVERSGNGFFQEYGYSSIATLTVTGSKFVQNTAGISTGVGTMLTLDVRDSEFTDNASGIVGAARQVSIANTTITGFTARGLDVQPQNPCSVKVRGTTIAGNAATYGVFLYCAAGSTLDFGTLAEPGGNTITGGAPGMQVNGPGQMVSAVGNTWRPNEQGSDAQGQYAAQGPGGVLDVTGGAGLNYRAGTNTLRLAENP